MDQLSPEATQRVRDDVRAAGDGWRLALSRDAPIRLALLHPPHELPDVLTALPRSAIRLPFEP